MLTIPIGVLGEPEEQHLQMEELVLGEQVGVVLEVYQQQTVKQVVNQD